MGISKFRATSGVAIAGGNCNYSVKYMKKNQQNSQIACLYKRSDRSYVSLATDSMLYFQRHKLLRLIKMGIPCLNEPTSPNCSVKLPNEKSKSTRIRPEGSSPSVPRDSKCRLFRPAIPS